MNSNRLQQIKYYVESLSDEEITKCFPKRSNTMLNTLQTELCDYYSTKDRVKIIVDFLKKVYNVSLSVSDVETLCDKGCVRFEIIIYDCDYTVEYNNELDLIESNDAFALVEFYSELQEYLSNYQWIKLVF